MLIQYFPAQAAFSEFAIEKKLRAICPIAPEVCGLKIDYGYVVNFAREPNELDRLHELLAIEQDPPKQVSPYYRLIAPRPGTHSPWSSQATDIAHHCGLHEVQRIERFCHCQVVLAQGAHPISDQQMDQVMAKLYDRMTEQVFFHHDELAVLFDQSTPRPLGQIALKAQGRLALEQANEHLGLALTEDEMDYLQVLFRQLGRDPSDAELMMYAQIHSEHCRHKLFNASWTIAGQAQPRTLFEMIANTCADSTADILSAYKDNAAVIAGFCGSDFSPDPKTNQYEYTQQMMPVTIKVETHNHPTAISPMPGAATGAGGEIRDHGATGRGAKPKAGLCGFCVSHLKIPTLLQPWEVDYGKPQWIASALDIMLSGPIGAAAFNNEFGRPVIAGYFRSYEYQHDGEVIYGYHKPIMLSGGLGYIDQKQVDKKTMQEDSHVLVIGGPAMLIGLGGGAASSMASGVSDTQLDFASVQRADPQMQRRCQEVINHCMRLGKDNPILSIHDVGAGGLSNAIPELVQQAGGGAQLDLRKITSAEPGLSAMEIWSNEAQERYVLVIQGRHLPLFQAFCRRERCPVAVLGNLTHEKNLVVKDPLFANRPVDMPLDRLFGSPALSSCLAKRSAVTVRDIDLSKIKLRQAVYRVLQLPAVADKSFLISIVDRSVTGLIARDQMVGPWQVPVSDVAVSMNDFNGIHGEAMSIGERSPVATLDAPASARMAIGEALTNIAAADIEQMSDIKLSANWMAACDEPGDCADLFDAVKAVGMELCPQLGLRIPVGKDSLSMRSIWQEHDRSMTVRSPLSLVISAFAPVRDVRRTLTPQIRVDRGDSCLLLIDLSREKNRLGASALAQVYRQTGGRPADLDSPQQLMAFCTTLRLACREDLVWAYHDRSDGGLLATICEMTFAGRCAVELDLSQLVDDTPLPVLFNEELGAVIQVRLESATQVMSLFQEAGLMVFNIGVPGPGDRIVISAHDKTLLDEKRLDLHRAWSATSYHLQAIRDQAECARQEYDKILDEADPGLVVAPSYLVDEEVAAPYLVTGVRPKVAIIREQGVNGHVEMAAAFDRAGFAAIDVHMSDIITGQVSLADFPGLVLCGGFSYGDVLGAGRAWAKSILFNPRAYDVFSAFFIRPDSFALGVCNGCQVLSEIKSLIPGADNWPHFARNLSEQFESRLVMVGVPDNVCVLTDGMAGSIVPGVVAHREGRAVFADGQLPVLEKNRQIVGRYVDAEHKIQMGYPGNPSGSTQGVCGLTTPDGRFTMMMIHPERGFMAKQHSWCPDDWQQAGAWMRLFRNARVFVA